MENEVLIHVQNLCKTYGSTKAVNDVTFDILKGEIRGLIGENGSGKSTLVSMLAGINQITSGAIYLEGKEFTPKHQVEANDKGISIILQEMATIGGLSVADNIFFGHEDKFIKFGIKNIKRMNTQADKYLKEFDFKNIHAGDDISLYNFEQRKLVEMVRAAYYNPKLVIIDETTTALSHNGREELYKLMKKVRAMGNTVIFISHDLQEVIKSCNSITIFRDGRYVDTVQNKDLKEEDLKSLMVGREISNKYYREDYDVTVSNEVVMQVKAVSLSNKLSNINLELHSGEILGLGGLSESGLHEIGKVIFGAEVPDKGQVILPKKNINIKSIKQAIEYGIGYISKNRDEEALMNNSSIKDNICISCMNKLQTHGFISPKKEYEFADTHVKKLDLKMESVEQLVSSLSGGNKQKVALTKWLSRNSDILVLDSPTRGIDIMVKSKIYRIMEELKAEGKSIIMISEELMELIGMSDRVIVFKDGEVSGEFLRDEALCEDMIIQKMI